jgi:hypothetical protein
MKFDEIVKHLSDHGFVTRASFDGHLVMAYGMDNGMHMYYSDGRKNSYSPSLADMKAMDWMILPFWWDGPKDDFLPFSSKEGRDWRTMLGVSSSDIGFPKCLNKDVER